MAVQNHLEKWITKYVRAAWIAMFKIKFVNGDVTNQ